MVFMLGVDTQHLVVSDHNRCHWWTKKVGKIHFLVPILAAKFFVEVVLDTFGGNDGGLHRG